MVTWYPRSLWSTCGLNSQLVYEARPEEGPPVPTKGSRALLPQRRCGEAGRPLGGALGGERRRKREKRRYDSRFRSSSSASQATLPNPRSALLTQRPERNSKRFFKYLGLQRDDAGLHRSPGELPSDSPGHSPSPSQPHRFRSFLTGSRGTSQFPVALDGLSPHGCFCYRAAEGRALGPKRSLLLPFASVNITFAQCRFVGGSSHPP